MVSSDLNEEAVSFDVEHNEHNEYSLRESFKEQYTNF